MPKHRKCDNCGGRGVNIRVVTDSNGRLRSIEEKCPVCKGTGYMEIAKASDSEIRVNPK